MVVERPSPLSPAPIALDAPLVGRTGELELIDGMLGALEERGAALIFRGEAGIGKSALLATARRAALDRGLRVLSTGGVERESGQPFAALHRLLRPVLTRLDRLLDSQRTALLGAVGMRDGQGVDPFPVALAALELLVAEAAAQPLLLIVDDLQWLDPQSRTVIAFVGRRIAFEPIVLLAAVRTGREASIDSLDLPVHDLPGLEADVAGQVIDTCAPGLAPAIRRRVIAEAAGNPLALHELPGTLSSMASSVAVDSGLVPVTPRLEQALAGQVRGLPGSTGALLLLAAADAASSLADVLAAGRHLIGDRVPVAALQPAIDADLIALDGIRLRFRRPLMRSVIYQAAGLERRQAAHAALSRVLDAEPDRAALHRAAATFAHDDRFADELDSVAARARARGAILTAAEVLARAAALSADRERRAGRLLESAELALELGRADVVRVRVQEARALPLAPRASARAEWIIDVSRDSGEGGAGRALKLVELAVDASRDGDVDLALKLLAGAALRCWRFGLAPAVGAEIAAAAAGMPVDAADARLLVTIAFIDPLGRAADVADGVAVALRCGPLDAARAGNLGFACHAIGDHDASLRLLTIASDGLRDQRRLGLLARTAMIRSVDAIEVGAWRVAAEAAGEATRLAAETDQPIWWAAATASLSALAGLRGDAAAATSLADDAQAVLHGTDVRGVRARVQVARGLAALTAGEYDAAWAHLTRVLDPRSPCHHPRHRFAVVAPLADVAVRCEREREARAVLAELEGLAAPTTAAGVWNGIRYARALLASDDDAEAEYRTALAAPWSAARPFDRARLNLAYGMWLRRRRRVVESRAPLRLAARGFDDPHTRAWGEQARDELRAAGESSALRGDDAWDRLSPQERQIGEYAAAGMSNREIGELLYLSHRTVASHLYRMFPKLGITARAQLAGVLTAPAPEPVSRAGP